MTKNTALRLTLLLAGTLLATSLVVGNEREQKDRLSEPSVRTRPETRATVSDSRPGGALLDISLLNRRPTSELEDNLFALPLPPAPPAPPPPPPTAVIQAPPPKPVAPPLPFKFLGTMVDGTKLTLFIAQGTQNLSVRQGDLIDDLYRVEQVSDAGIVFTYLPLDEKQTLSIGGRN